MPITDTKAVRVLSATVAVRLTDDECRAPLDIARCADRTVSYVIRAQLRNRLREHKRGA